MKNEPIDIATRHQKNEPATRHQKNEPIDTATREGWIRPIITTHGQEEKKKERNHQVNVEEYRKPKNGGNEQYVLFGALIRGSALSLKSLNLSEIQTRYQQTQEFKLFSYRLNSNKVSTDSSS